MSDQVIAEIERSVDTWWDKTKRHCMVYYAGQEWVASCHALSVTVRGPDVMTVLCDFDRELQRFTDHSAKLAQTLGLEAAE